MKIDRNLLLQKNMSSIKNLATVSGSISIEEIYHEIKGTKHKDHVEMIQRYHREGKGDDAQSAKKSLPGFTTSGIFNIRRKKDNLSSYIGFICLDLDEVPVDRLQEIKEKACKKKETILCFISPSGMGLKIICCTGGKVVDHWKNYQKVRDYYTNQLGVKFDEHTSDIARLCFMSYDPDIYYNTEAEVFGDVAAPQPNVHKNPVADLPNSNSIEGLFLLAKKCTELTSSYLEGNRNNFIYQLANNCNRAGIQKEEMIELLSKHLPNDLPKMEVAHTVDSAYEHTDEFNTWSLDKFNRILNAQSDQEQNNTGMGQSSTSTQLPDIDKRIKVALGYSFIHIGLFLIGHKGDIKDLHINKSEIKWLFT